MPFYEFITFFAFVFVGSFTPGPNTTIATATGVNHGLRAAIPQILGVPLGFVAMVWLIGMGGGVLLQDRPQLLMTTKLLGVAYLLLLSWRLYFAKSGLAEKNMRPFTLVQAAAFQFINPKAWMIVLATTSTYAIGQSEFFHRMGCLSFGFALPSAVSLVTWAWIGQSLRTWLYVGNRLRWFNRAMGISLALSAVVMLMQSN